MESPRCGMCGRSLEELEFGKLLTSSGGLRTSHIRKVTGELICCWGLYCSRCGVHLIVSRVGLEDFGPGLKRYRFQVTIIQRLGPDCKQKF
jgi:hypothetical protein